MAEKEDFPGWGYMLSKGATTFYEDWECRGSALHSSYLYIGSWFIECLGGIRRPEAGYSHFVIEPWIDNKRGLREVKASYNSMYGKIVSQWKLEESGEFRLYVEIPPNTTSVVRIPEIVVGSLSIETENVTFAEKETHEIFLSSGSYTIKGKLLN